MAYDPGAIDATLAAAVGDEPALIAELRMRVRRQRGTRDRGDRERPPTTTGWALGAARLKGLAASFGAIRLMALASEAAATPHDAEMVRKLRRAVARL